MREFLHHLFLPRESNNYRAKLLHNKSILLLIIILFVGQFVLSSFKTNFPQVLGVAIDISTEELLTLTNQKRQEQGLLPLTFNQELSAASSLKAKDMFDKNYWAHTAPDGTTPWFFFKNVGYNYLHAGENLARGFAKSEDIVNAWMASPSHRENLLSGNYQEVGFAIVQGSLLGEDTTLVVQMFGERSAPIVARAGNVEIPTNVVNTSTTSSILSKSEKPVRQPADQKPVAVASLRFQPLVSSSFISRNLALFVMAVFLIMLSLDIVIIERKKIVRLVGHNIDHLIFLGVILMIIALVHKGIIL